MKKAIFALIFLLWFAQSLYSQADSTPDPRRRYLAWVSPSGATRVYGLMFNFWTRTELRAFSEYPKIYGVEINLNPLGLFFPFILAVHSLEPGTHQPPEEKIDNLNFKKFKQIYGVQAGLLNMEKTVVNGLDINFSGSFDSKINGVSLSVVMNKHYIINGLTVACSGNHDARCSGVQIGLINSCKNLKGFQIGLWNKNQKRSFPLINWCFSGKVK